MRDILKMWNYLAYFCLCLLRNFRFKGMFFMSRFRVCFRNRRYFAQGLSAFSKTRKNAFCVNCSYYVLIITSHLASPWRKRLNDSYSWSLHVFIFNNVYSFTHDLVLIINYSSRCGLYFDRDCFKTSTKIQKTLMMKRIFLKQRIISCICMHACV